MSQIGPSKKNCIIASIKDRFVNVSRSGESSQRENHYHLDPAAFPDPASWHNHRWTEKIASVSVVVAWKKNRHPLDTGRMEDGMCKRLRREMEVIRNVQGMKRFFQRRKDHLSQRRDMERTGLILHNRQRSSILRTVILGYQPRDKALPPASRYFLQGQVDTVILRNDLFLQLIVHVNQVQVENRNQQDHT